MHLTRVILALGAAAVGVSLTTVESRAEYGDEGCMPMADFRYFFSNPTVVIYHHVSGESEAEIESRLSGDYTIDFYHDDDHGESHTTAAQGWHSDVGDPHGDDPGGGPTCTPVAY